MTWIIAQLARLLYPPRIVAVTRRPAGWFTVDHRDRLVRIIAWGVQTDGVVVALVAGRRGLRPAVGRGWHGFLPAAPHAASDVQITPPTVTVPPADLVEAIGDARDVTLETQAEVYGRLKVAAMDEWATSAFLAFNADAALFLTRYWQRLAEHSHVADIDANWRDQLDASLTSPAVVAADVNPRIHAEGGKPS